MKIYFGFNDIRQDGMGAEATSLMRTLKNQGIEVQPVHPWKKVLIPQYIEEFAPVFLTDSEEEPALSDIISQMVEVVNSDKECSVFSHFGSPNWACIVPYLRPDIRVVVSIHSITPSALKIALSYKERTSMFVAISWEVQRKLYKQLPKSYHSKIKLITNALDTAQYPVKQQEPHTGKVRIVFFGRIEDYTKGCDKIPQIAKKLKEMNLDFIWDFYGYFHWGYEKRFYAYNKKYRVEDVISYKRCLQPNEIASVVSQYDIMVMPSNHEGFGLALIEAMSMGLACVASLIPHVTDMIVEHGKEGLLCERNNISQFADSIYQLAIDPNLRAQMGQAAHEKVATYFSLEKQGEDYKKAIEDILTIQNYTLIKPTQDLKSFKQPEAVKSHILARILPGWLKRFLKRYV